MTATIDQRLDQLGPVDWLVLELPGSDFGRGRVAPFLEDLVDRDLVRATDLLFVRKDVERTLAKAQISDLDESELGELPASEAELAVVISEQDLRRRRPIPDCPDTCRDHAPQ